MLAPAINIEIGGRVRVMRPTFKALIAIENELSASSMALVGRVMNGDLGATMTLAVIYHGLDGSTDRMDRDAIMSEIEVSGLIKYIPIVTKFFEAHLSGQPVGKQESDQQGQTTTPGATSTESA